MNPKRYPVILTAADRAALHALIAAGTAPAPTLTHARILLKADGPAWTDPRIAETLELILPRWDASARGSLSKGGTPPSGIVRRASPSRRR